MTQTASGHPVTFTATVMATGPGAALPTGTVTFQENGKPLGTASLNAAGLASWTFSVFSVRQHTVTAVYGGSAACLASTSLPLVQMVTP